MTKRFLKYVLSVVAALMLVFGASTVRARQTPSSDQTGSNTAKPRPTSKSKSKAKPKAGESATATSAPTAPPTRAPAPTPPSNATSSAAPASKPAPATKTSTQQTPPANSITMVWVNTDSGVYHKPGTRWYGKTKQGKFMPEADAIRAGYRAAEKE